MRWVLVGVVAGIGSGIAGLFDFHDTERILLYSGSGLVIYNSYKIVKMVVKRFKESRRDEDAAMNGGIDLTQKGMGWKTRKDPSTGSGQGAGVEFNVDPAVIARARREGIEFLAPRVLGIVPMTKADVWALAGLKPLVP